MAYGRYVMKNPTNHRPVVQQVSTRLAGRGGHFVQSPRGRNDGEPMAVNEDTARAVTATVATMLKGVKIKH